MKKYIFIVLAIVSVFSSCTHRGRFYVDKSSRPDCNVIVERFDKDLKTESIDVLYQKYGSFVDLYTRGILNLRSTGDINLFLSDKTVSELYDDVESKFEDLSNIEKELSEAFSIYKFYFPDSIIPRVLMHVSGFNQCVVITDSIISFSADDYLGSDYRMYKDVMYQYELPTAVPQRISLDVMLGHISTTFQSGDIVEQNLLDAMVENGKYRFLLSICFPDKSDAEILGYTQEKYEWAKRFGGNVWTNMMEERLLFSSDWRVLTNYIDPAPFTTGLSADSPGQMGIYIGYNLVKAYADNNPELSLLDIMNETSSQKILDKSAYNPR